LFIYELAKKLVIFAHQNLISNQLTYFVSAKSTNELISFEFSNRSVQSLILAISLSEIAESKRKTTSLSG